MIAKIKTYTNKDRYIRDYPDKEQQLESIQQGLKMAKSKIASVRGSNKFIGFKIFDKHGELKHKLPSQ